VVCIDQKPMHGKGLVWNHIPHGVEDQTGDRPLLERARWLKHAEFLSACRADFRGSPGRCGFRW